MRAAKHAWSALLVCLALSPGEAAAPAAAPRPAHLPAHLDIQLAARAASPGDTPVEITLRSDAPGREPLRRQATVAGPPLHLDLEEGVWTIETKAPGLWAPLRSLVLRQGIAHQARIDLFAASALRGRITLETPGDTAPAEIGVEVFHPIEKPGPRNPRPRPTSPEALALRCPVQDGAFECTAPAGVWDVRVRAPEHVSQYFWSRKLPSGGTEDLGSLALQRGASVAGWVAFDGPVRQSGGARVHLDLLQGAASATAEESARARALAAPVDERGFFHIAGVPAGVYRVTATMDGFAPAKLAPIRVFEGRESQVQETLVLHPPMALEVRVNPSSSFDQKPWHLQVFALGDTTAAMDRAGEGDTSEDGAWRLPNLSAGRYLVKVLDQTGKPWAFQETELAFASAQVDFDIDLVNVEGTLRLGGAPLAATLYFGGKMGVPSFRFTSDEKGRFSGTLSREGAWRTEIEARNPPIQLSLRKVEVRRPRGKSVAHLDLDLPDGHLRGAVVDENGQPVPAMVRLSPPSEVPTLLRTDGQGLFAARGFAPGKVMVQARSSQGTESDAAWARVGKSEDDTPAVRLVLKKKRPVPGIVVGPFGGVPGAQIQAVAEGQAQSTAVTDLAGRFTLPLPAAATYADLVVIAPGYTLDARRVQLGEPGQDLRVLLDPEGGTLTLEGLPESTLEGTPEGTENGGTFWSLTANGAQINAGTLSTWARSNGASVAGAGKRAEYPQLAAGNYELCRVPFSAWEDYLQGGRIASRCAAGVLAPGGRLTLKLPAAPTGN